MSYPNGEESLNKYLSPDTDPDHLKPAKVEPCVPAFPRKRGITQAHTGRLSVDYAALSNNRCFRSTGNVWTPAYSCLRYRRQNAGVEHALFEQLTLFPNASIVFEDVDTHRSDFRRRVNAQTKRRQSHVNAGTVPESENAGT